MNNQVNWMQQGWECPKCGAVMSPHTDCCVNCRGNKGGFSIITIGDPAPTTDNNWTGYPPINDPSSTCSSSSPLHPPYVLTNEAPEAKYPTNKEIAMIPSRIKNDLIYKKIEADFDEWAKAPIESMNV